MKTPTEPSKTNESPPLLVDAKTAARLCGIGTSTFWRWDGAGRIPRPVRLGGTTRWRLAELEAWIEAGCPDRAAWKSLKEAAEGKSSRRKGNR